MKNDDRVMILIPESLQQTPGTSTPLTNKSDLQQIKGQNEVGEGKINYPNGKDPALQKQIKSGHYKGLSKLFKDEASGISGLLGAPVPPSKEKKRSDKLSREKKVKVIKGDDDTDAT